MNRHHPIYPRIPRAARLQIPSYLDLAVRWHDDLGELSKSWLMTLYSHNPPGRHDPRHNPLSPPWCAAIGENNPTDDEYIALPSGFALAQSRFRVRR